MGRHVFSLYISTIILIMIVNLANTLIIIQLTLILHTEHTPDSKLL